MICRFKYKNWKKNIPSDFWEYLFSPCNNGLKIMNFFCQKILGINREMKFMVHFTSQVSGNVDIGRNVAVYMAGSGNCYIQGINGIKIGDFTMIAPGVKIISANHHFSDYSKHISGKPILIGNNCWIGANAIILPEVELGDHVIVGAGSVVTKSFGRNTVIAGNPARIIKYQDS